MLIILSPAKTMDFDIEAPVSKTTQPALLSDAAQLVQRVREMNARELGELMRISDKLATVNHARFADWETPHPRRGSKAALFAFQGDVYRGINAGDFSAAQIDYAQQHLRILSGLYGCLRPLDRILPYRLEMGTPLANDRGKDLYAFWGDRIALQLNQQLKSTGDKMLLNLASQEYFKAVACDALNVPMVSPVFQDFKNGSYKIISVYAKQARGTMASWVIRNRVKSLKKLTQFADDGYRYDAQHSSDAQPVFRRGGP